MRQLKELKTQLAQLKTQLEEALQEQQRLEAKASDAEPHLGILGSLGREDQVGGCAVHACVGGRVCAYKRSVICVFFGLLALKIT